DALRLGFIEICDDCVQLGVSCIAEGGDFRDTWMTAQLLQPAHFHLHPAADQPEFTEDTAQSKGFAAIAAINRGYSVERGKGGKCGFHGRRSLSAIRLKGRHDTQNAGFFQRFVPLSWRNYGS